MSGRAPLHPGSHRRGPGRGGGGQVPGDGPLSLHRTGTPAEATYAPPSQGKVDGVRSETPPVIHTSLAEKTTRHSAPGHIGVIPGQGWVISDVMSWGGGDDDGTLVRRWRDDRDDGGTMEVRWRYDDRAMARRGGPMEGRWWGDKVMME